MRKYLTDLVDSTDFSRNLVEDLQHILQATIGLSPEDTAPAADPAHRLTWERAQLSGNLQLHSGVIHFSHPLLGSQKVAVDTGGGLVVCNLGGMWGNDQHAKDVSTPPHGAEVLLISDIGTGQNTIICSRPPVQLDSADAFCDSIVAGSGVGVYASPVYRDTLSKTQDAGGSRPHAGDRPIDGLPGDLTWMTSNGIGLHLDTEMAYLRTSEICGLFLFREDGHTRLSGESLHLEAIGGSWEAGIASQEVYGRSEHCFYPWEAVGLAMPATLNLLSPSIDEQLYRGGAGPAEPAAPTQAPLARLRELWGYLAQGWMRTVVTPVTTGVNQFDNPIDQRALFREQVLLDGSYLLESASRLFLAKTTQIPVILPQVVDPELEYSPSGYYGSGDPHQPHQPPMLADPLASAMAPEEVYAYTSAWQATHAAVYNPGYVVDYPLAPASFTANLEQTDRVLPPDPTEVPLDHRYGNISLRELLSFIAILDDGTLVLRDGAGGEIRIGHGGVEISGAFTNIRSAKTTSIISGRVSIRGQRDVELVSSTKSVRVKAEQNLLLLSGNGGIGGTLIECRGHNLENQLTEEAADATHAGVVIKSARTPIALHGGDIYLRTGPASAGHLNGRILLDAGNNEIIQKAGAHRRFTKSYFTDHFLRGDRIAGTNSLSRTVAIFGSSMHVDGQLLVREAVQAGTGFSTASGHYASTENEVFRGLVGTERYPGRITDAFQDMADYNRQAAEAAAESEQAARETFEIEGRSGHGETLGQISVGFPSSTGYAAAGSSLLQSYWERSGIVPSARWIEPVVRYRGQEETRPWPGQQSWTKDDGFVYLDEEGRYYDQASQRPIDPTLHREKYEQASAEAPRRGSIADLLQTSTH